MAVRPILELPHPALRRRAKRVRRLDSSVMRLAYDMVDTLHMAAGVGLAANQVGDFRRVIVVQLPDEDEARIYVNPEIVHREGSRRVEEGCLSIPGYRGLITRSLWVRFRALDHASKTVRLRAEDLLSQVLEHEVDHLNGMLYVDHLERHEKLIPVSPEPDDGDGADSPAEDDAPPQPVSVDSPGPGSSWAADQRESPATLKVS